MIAVRKQKYLIPKDQIMFLKDLGANRNVYQEYGWKNTGTIFKAHMLSYAIEFLTEEIDHEINEDGDIVNTVYGIERVPDPMLLKEMSEYHDGLNVDRLVSFAALIAFVKIQEANRGFRKVIEKDPNEDLEKSRELFKLNKSPFTHIGRGRGSNSSTKVRNPFRNIK
jgi:hypothetical protein